MVLHKNIQCESCHLVVERGYKLNKGIIIGTIFLLSFFLFFQLQLNKQDVENPTKYSVDFAEEEILVVKEFSMLLAEREYVSFKINLENTLESLPTEEELLNLLEKEEEQEPTIQTMSSSSNSNNSSQQSKPKSNSQSSEPKQTTQTTNTSNHSQSDEELLARMIWAESRGEPYEGKVAVGAVIMNRVKSSRFPNTLRDVLYQPRQFSPVGDGSFNRANPGDSEYRAAREALYGNDPTKGALFFYNPEGTSQTWHETLTHTVTIGSHRFFR